MHRLTKRLGIAAVLALLVSGAVVTTAVARHHTKHHNKHHQKHGLPLTTIHCGMPITKSIKVANNLTCDVPMHPGMPPMGTPPFGIFVPHGKSHITIDLNGHTLSGPRIPGTSRDLAIGHSVEMIGVQLMGVHDVTVRNGTVRHFDAGISDSHGNHNHFFKLTVADNQNYEVVSGAIDYLPPSPSLKSVTATGPVTTPATYTYEVVTAQAPSPDTTPGDNGAGGSSLTQDSLESRPKTVTNDATLSAANFNTITFTGVGSAYATGYRILRSTTGNPGSFIWVGTVPANPASNMYTFVDNGQAPAGGTTPYHAVSLENHNVSVNDTCDNGDGLVLDASNGDVVNKVTSIDNGPFSGIALVGEYNGHTYDGAGYNRIKDSRMWHNAVLNIDPAYNNPHNRGMPAYCGTGAGGGGMTRGREVQDSGIRIEGPNAQHNTISGNTVSGSGFNGIAIHSFVCNSTGPEPNGTPNSFNTIAHNIVTGTGRYTPAGEETNLDGIGWLASGPPNVVCVSPNNTVMFNRSYANMRDGIYMGGRANGGNYVADNTVYENASNGIEVAAGGPGYGQPANRFTRNVGYNNTQNDAFDGNPSCAGNSWVADRFHTVNVPCVQ